MGFSGASVLCPDCGYRGPTSRAVPVLAVILSGTAALTSGSAHTSGSPPPRVLMHRVLNSFHSVHLHDLGLC